MRGFGALLLICYLGTCLGAGVTHGTETEGEADLSGTETVKRLISGYFFELFCNMTSEENTSFTLDWYKNDKKLEGNDHIKIFSTNSSLIIKNPKKEDVGTYKCQTKPGIPKDKPLYQKFLVIYFDIRRMPKSMTITNQKELTLECPVEGKPYPNIAWKKDMVPILDLMANDSRFSLAPNSKDVPNAKLIISTAETDDRGNYTCAITTATNSTFVVFTFVRVKDMYAALWPFLGIVVEVLLLGIIIFIFEKRRAKAEFEESDTDQGNDQKNTDHHKDSVRQRK